MLQRILHMIRYYMGALHWTHTILLITLSSCEKETTHKWLDRSMMQVVPGKDTLQNIISENTLLTNEHIWYIDGWVYVANETTLTIEPGTTIRMLPRPISANEYATGLVITRGATINAIGTPYSPVRFMVSPTGKEKKLGWSGIIMLGRSPDIAGPLSASQSPTGCSLAYGGNLIKDSSGVLKYVRITLPDSLIQKKKRKLPAGVYMLGTGSKTKLEYVIVEQSGKQQKVAGTLPLP